MSACRNKEARNRDSLKQQKSVDQILDVCLTQDDGEMRFSLPAAPSPAVLLALLAACRELERAGGHAAGAPALALLEWDLLGTVLQGLGKALAPGGALDRGLSEKGMC
jgi:hypothetical protein